MNFFFLARIIIVYIPRTHAPLRTHTVWESKVERKNFCFVFRTSLIRGLVIFFFFIACTGECIIWFSYLHILCSQIVLQNMTWTHLITCTVLYTKCVLKLKQKKNVYWITTTWYPIYWKLSTLFVTLWFCIWKVETNLFLYPFCWVSLYTSLYIASSFLFFFFVALTASLCSWINL